MSGRFARLLRGDISGAPPIWLMRQAGRYQASYRALRQRHSFEDLCKQPALAAEVALAPIREFDFDAAILFSDLLFPLEALGMSLSYASGPPELDAPLTAARIERFRSTDDAESRLRFQAEALAATRAQLPADRGLIGFVGGPWTLFVYAMEGTHAGALARAKAAADLYAPFAARMIPLLEQAIARQLAAGADLVMIFDTAAGELPPQWFSRLVLPDLARLAHAAPHRLAYFGKGMHPDHYRGAFAELPWAGVGYDARWDLPRLLQSSARATGGFVQGNFDPALLRLDGRALVDAVREFLAPFGALPSEARRSWMCGLGHGVLPQTPESSVRTFVQLVREACA